MSISTRKLSVIMFTDIQGYTSLMGRDEQKALEILRKSRSIQKKHIENHNGRWLKEMGDGVLAQFESANDGVNCAIDIQKESHESLEAKIRIGIHLGDVTIENEDIFGDGVNIASRLQSAADPGGIYLSDSVYKAIKANPEIETLFLGDKQYKNVDYPLATYAVQGEVFPIPSLDPGSSRKPSVSLLRILITVAILIISGVWYFYPTSSEPLVESIAVLPFENLTNSDENDVFVAGMHDALISELGRVNALRVISKTSTLRYRNTDLSLSEIASELGVEAVVESSVFQADSLVNLQVKLIKVYPEEANLWSGTVSRDFSHILEVYRTITGSIVDEIRVAILGETQERLNETVIINPEAYTAYLNGKYHMSSLSLEGMQKAMEYFEVSVKEDPDFAPAYGGMASLWARRQQMGFTSREEAVPAIELNLERALSLDDNLAETYYNKGVVEAWTNWDWLEAEKAFQEALSINPNLAEAHAFYSHLLMCLKRPIEMKLHMDKAVEVDPYNPLIQVLKGVELAISGQSSAAIEHFQPLDKLAPNNPLVQIGMWFSYHTLGDEENAFLKQKKILELVSRDDDVVRAFEESYHTDGYRSALKTAADMWTNRADSTFVPPDNIFWLYAAAGEQAKTIEWLEKGYEMHDSNMPYAAVLPLFDDLQDNPEYLNLLDRLNLPR